MSCSVVYRTKGPNISLSFCSHCFSLSLHVSSLKEGLDGWTQFPSHLNIPGQERERSRSLVCSCAYLCVLVFGVCVSNTFTDSGLCVKCVTFRAFTLEAAKGIDALSSLAQAWQLLALVYVCKRKKRNTQ